MFVVGSYDKRARPTGYGLVGRDLLLAASCIAVSLRKATYRYRAPSSPPAPCEPALEVPRSRQWLSSAHYGRRLLRWRKLT